MRVLGLSPTRDAAALKPQIGVMLQQDGLYPALTAREVLRLFAGYFQHPQDIDALLARVGLSEAAKTRCRRLSGGQNAASRWQSPSLAIPASSSWMSRRLAWTPRRD